MKERPESGRSEWRITHGVQRRVRGGPLKSARVGLNKLAGTYKKRRALSYFCFIKVLTETVVCC